VPSSVDLQTLAAYDNAATVFAQDWHDQPPASDLHAIIKRFFLPGLTADVGCGGGRDAAWLTANGFPAIGYDASEGLLREARRRYPQLRFELSALPELPGVAAEAFDNVLCETVLMHLPADAVASSVDRLLTILKPGGVLYVSWRVSQSDQRDAHGRLYAALDPVLITQALTAETMLLDEEFTSASSGKIVHRVVARKHLNTT
jgi:SAM-dependent methyltransferase